MYLFGWDASLSTQHYTAGTTYNKDNQMTTMPVNLACVFIIRNKTISYIMKVLNTQYDSQNSTFSYTNQDVNSTWYYLFKLV